MISSSFRYHSALLLFAGLLLLGCDLLESESGGQSDTTPGDTTEVASLVQERFNEQPAGTGLVVGIVDGSDQQTLARGVTRAEGDSVDKHTVFEIGSITKTFTALALADRVEQGAVRLGASVAASLPDSVDVPGQDGTSITLEHLVTHTAGLPRLAPNQDEQSEWEDPTDPYAAYSVPELYRGLEQTTLLHAPGTAFQYSNFGAGLLGHLLAQRADTTYRGLIRNRISARLGMEDTWVDLPEAPKQRFATGHRPDGSTAPHWHFQESMAGAGALRPSARDMMIYLAAQLGQAGAPSPLRRAIERSHTTLYDQEDERTVAYGWFVGEQDGHTVFAHTGGTGGFKSFVGFSPETNVGVVVLSNVAQSVNEMGLDLLDTVLTNTKEDGQG
ncbi:MAG: serine hydrolase domain-containing protein [Candidatus Bipolaricaulia bacterium]